MVALVMGWCKGKRHGLQHASNNQKLSLIASMNICVSVSPVTEKHYWAFSSISSWTNKKYQPNLHELCITQVYEDGVHVWDHHQMVVRTKQTLFQLERQHLWSTLTKNMTNPFWLCLCHFTFTTGTDKLMSTHFTQSIRTESVWLVSGFGLAWCKIKLKMYGHAHHDTLMSKPGFYNSKWSLYKVVSGEVHWNHGLLKGFSSFNTCTKIFGAIYEKIYPRFLYIDQKYTDDNNLCDESLPVGYWQKQKTSARAHKSLQEHVSHKPLGNLLRI